MIAQTMPLRAFVHAALLPKVAPKAVRPHAASPAEPMYLSSKRAFNSPLARRTISTGADRTCSADTSASSLVDKVKQQNEKHTVIVYSKSYCPYCASVKSLFGQLQVDFKVMELDQLADGAEVQDALSEVTGRHTVPQVFIKGSFIGGADDTRAKYNSGELKKLFSDAGVSATF